MRKKKSFEFSKDKYYFNIKLGPQSSITINRTEKKEAVTSFNGYLRAKKNCEWLGRWDGKKFIEDNFEKISSN